MQGVHVPIQAPQKYLDMYSHVSDDVRRQYLACTTARDRHLNRIRIGFWKPVRSKILTKLLDRIYFGREKHYTG